MKLRETMEKAKVLKYTLELLHDGEKGSKEKFQEDAPNPVTGSPFLEIFQKPR